MPYYAPESVSPRTDGFVDIAFSLPRAEIDKLLLKLDLNSYKGSCNIQRLRITGVGRRNLYEFSDNALQHILVPVRHISNMASRQKSLHIDVLGAFPLLGIDFHRPIGGQSIAETIRQYNAEIFFPWLLSLVALFSGILALLLCLWKKLECLDVWGKLVFQAVFSTTFRSLSVLLICLLSIGLYVFYDFIISNKCLLYYDIASDTTFQIWPFMLQFMERLHQNGGLFWSFRLGIGTPTHAFEQLYGLYDPLNVLFYLVSRENIPYIFVFVLILKILFGGIGWFYFLRKIQIHPFVAVIMSILYAYSGYMIGFGSWVLGTAGVMILPFVFLSIECFLQDKHWYYFPMTIAWYAIATNGWVELFQVAVWCFTYLGLRYFFVSSSLNLKRSLCDGLSLLALFGFGISFVAVILFPQIQYLLFDRVRGGQTLSTIPIGVPLQELIVIWFRIFSNDLLGTPGQNSISAFATNYFGVPFLYNGLLNLLLLISLFIFGKRKSKWAALLFLFIGMLFLVSPLFRSLLWGGELSYYRTSGLYHVFVINILAAISLNTFLTQSQPSETYKNDSIMAVGLGLCLLFIATVNILHLSDKSIIIAQDVVKYTLWSIILYSLLLTLIVVRKYLHIVLIILLLAVCYEAGTSAWRTLRYKRKIADAHYCIDTETEDVLADLYREDSTFYRLEKSYETCGYHDPMFQSYYGMSSYASLNTPSFITFLQSLYDNINPIRVSGKNIKQPVRSLLGMKYYLSYHNGVQRTYNEYYIPLGAYFDTIITEEHFQALPQELQETVLLHAVVVDQETADMPELKSFETLKSDSITKESTLSVVREKQKNALAIQEFKSDSIRGSFNTTKQQILFFSIPYSAGWQLFVDKQATRLYQVDFGLMAAIIEPGKHEIHLLFTPPFLVLGAGISLCCVVIFSILLIGRGKPFFTQEDKTLRKETLRTQFMKFTLLAVLMAYVFGYFFLWFRNRQWPVKPRENVEYVQRSETGTNNSKGEH